MNVHCMCAFFYLNQYLNHIQLVDKQLNCVYCTSNCERDSSDFGNESERQTFWSKSRS